MSTIKDYTPEVQHLFIQFLISDPELFSRCQNIVEVSHFDRKYRDTISLIKDHCEKYNSIPKLEQINAVGRAGFDLIPISDITEDHQQWFLDEFEQFCRHKALEKAIIESTDLLGEKRYGEVEEKIKKAVQVGLVKDLGLDYFENPMERLQWIRDQSGAISTGWKGIDQKLYGGLNRGEITVFAGGSGSGKSLFLQNFGVNWSLAGLNVVYISFELSEQLVSLRLDSMVSGYGAREIMKNMEDVDLKVRMKSKGAGRFRIKYLPSGSSINDIRVFLREYEIQKDIKVDAILVDYLDLMSPASKKISAENMFVKDKYVSEELRNLAAEKNLLMVTASQLNRGAVEEVEFDHSHIAGGISKINTADNVVGIFTSNAMRERGRYQIQFMKTRSSSGVGAKVDLAFDIDTLRIYDLEEDDDDAITTSSKSILEQMKRNNNMTADEEEPQSTVNQSLGLRDFIRNKK